MGKNTRNTTGSTSLRNPLAQYLRELDDTPLLTEAEEQSLAPLAKAGNMDARNKLIKANLRLVVSIAKRFRGYGLDFEDVIEEGNLGLMQAIDGYEVERETRFATFATLEIRQAIWLALGNSARTIRIPVYMVDLMRKAREEMGKLEMASGRKVKSSELLQVLDVTKKRFDSLLKTLRITSTKSLADDWDNIVGDNGAARAELVTNLESFLVDPTCLTEDEYTVIKGSFGIGLDEMKTNEMLQRELGVGKEAIQIIKKDH